MKADIIAEDDYTIAFSDIDPKAPEHVLVIPKEHIDSLHELKDEALAGRILISVQKTADSLNLQEKGYRVVTNIGRYGGQSVAHLHFHILGGRALSWPPG